MKLMEKLAILCRSSLSEASTPDRFVVSDYDGNLINPEFHEEF